MATLRGGVVRTAGFEPTLPEGKQILSLQRLPVSPRPHDFAVCLPRLVQARRKRSAEAPIELWIRKQELATAQTLSRSRISLPGLK